MRFFTLFCLFTSMMSLSAQDYEIDTQFYVGGLNQPLGVENVGDDRLFVIEKAGTIAIVDGNGDVLPNKFLDITNLTSTNGERGLLGLAFHPDYSVNGLFYVNYTNTAGNTVIASFEVNPSNPNDALENSRVELLTYDQPFSNHNGGDVTFGDDGMLYIASGDGGSGNDPMENAQNLNSLLGKILRLDVDNAPTYIPNDNPYVADDDDMTLPEIWAYGLRNPFRMSFDSMNGDFWIGDVGQNAIEEINKVENNPAAVNYGWRCFEGNSTADSSSDCLNTSSPATAPLVDYPQTQGRCSVTGGRVYRGSQFQSLQGIYVFADFCTNELGVVDDTNTITFRSTTSGGSFTGFGVDNNDELYVTSIGGTIYRVVDNLTLGINSQPTSTGFAVLPNPAHDSFRIDTDLQSTIVVITNMTGQQVLRTSVLENENINVSALAQGLYFVSVLNDEETIIATKKLAVKH